MIKSSEIKKTALNKLKRKWANALGITALFTLLNLALSYALIAIQNITTNIPILYFFTNILYLSIFLMFSFGLIASLHKLSNGEKTTMTSFINESFLNASKTICIFIRTLIKILIPSLFIVIGIIGILFVTVQIIPLSEATLSGYSIFIALLYLAISVGIIISAIPYVLSLYILADNKNMTAKDIVNQSALLMEHHKWNFIKLIFSFILWFLLIAIIATIIEMQTIEMMSDYVQWFCMIFLMPYLITSISVFYEETLNTSNTIVENNKE